MLVMRMKIAVIARICGNICSSTRASRPGRRPLNRNRLNAKAPAADIRVEMNDTDKASTSVFMNHVPKGLRGSLKIAWKLSRLKVDGNRQVIASGPVLSGGHAADNEPTGLSAMLMM